MTDDLTGRIRYRVSKDFLLVLQVEYMNTDSEFSPSTTLWRDAKVEDLTILPRPDYPNLKGK